MTRLLLVEDEQVNRELFRRRLERKGYAVVTAETGLDAVAITKGQKPDLVLMDLGLPDIDGWEATRRIKADPATAAIPVVVLSAHATADARAKAFAAGCEEFETKPVNWDALFKKIDAAVERAKAKAPPPPRPRPPRRTTTRSTSAGGRRRTRGRPPGFSGRGPRRPSRRQRSRPPRPTRPTMRRTCASFTPSGSWWSRTTTPTASCCAGG